MFKYLLKCCQKSFALHVVILFTPIALGIIGMAGYGYVSEKEQELRVIALHELTVVDTAKDSILQSLERVKNDVQYLSEYHDFQDYIVMGLPENLTHISHDLTLIMQSRRVYDQIRWIDEAGMERLRINFNNGHPALVPVQQLQNKKERYYFSEAMQFKEGETYFSSFDLNVDKGKVEIPYKPTIRAATPILDKEGNKKGIFVINYLGNELIEALIDSTTAAHGDVMLLNDQGYWLKGVKKSDEWGFVFNRPDLSFSHRYPAAWQRIAKAQEGQFVDEAGMWTFTTVHPSKNALGIVNGSGLKVVLFLPADKLTVKSDALLVYLSVFILLGLSAAGIWSFVLAYLYRKQQLALQALSELHQQLEASEKKYKNLAKAVEQIDDSVYITDKFGNISYVNDAYCRHTGYTKDEVIGKNSRISKSGMHDHDFYKHLWTTILSGEVYRNTLINRKKNGDLYYEKKTISPLKDDLQHVVGFISTGKDVTQETMLHQEVERIATIDKLTGIYNRHKLEEIFILESERSRRFSHPLSMILIDIDHFKSVNDTYGHNVGDEVLKRLVEVVQENIRKIDVFARWGGEEFLVLSPHTDFDNIQNLAEKLRKAVESSPFPEIGHITISLGIAAFEKDDTFSELFKRADQGLYDAKEHGRNQVGVIKA